MAKQLIMRPLLNNSAAIQHYKAVHTSDGGEAMGDDYTCAIDQQRLKGILY
jgi:hypothetical protein